MKNIKKGFTLIELLVVVLIIGILAAVALPQYQKAVEKSHATQALTILKNLYAAEQEYYMANGEYATKFDALSVKIPWTGGEKWFAGIYATDTRSNGKWSLQIYNGTAKALYLGRLNGPYKGVGWILWLEGAHVKGSFFTDSPVKSGEIICSERVGAGLTFSGEEGAYCGKIFGGSKIFQSSDVREYRIPWAG